MSQEEIQDQDRQQQTDKPGLSQFRAPARAVFVTTLALAVLAAMGYQAIVCGRLSGAAIAALLESP